MKRTCSAFTLIELLVVVAIVAILVSLLAVAVPAALERGRQSASLSNMRQVGVGFQLYANDNDMRLPSRVNTGDRWPVLLNAYIQGGVKIYADPSDADNFVIRKTDPLSNSRNNTSYMMNGFNDAGAYDDQTLSIRLNGLDAASKTILLCQAIGHANFYMDTREGNQNTAIRKDAFNGGSNYLFADGSVQFIKKEDYKDDLWNVRKDAL